MAGGSLALGIGATTAMFSVIYAVLIDPFPYKDVANLVSPIIQEPGRRGYRSYYTLDQYLEFDRRSTIFDGLTFSTIDDVLWTGAHEPQRLRGNHTTMNGFSVMGVAPLIGRAPTPADAQPDAEPVAVLGYRFWQRQFGGSPGVLGKRLTLNGVARTIIGVMPRRFMWRGADVYLPMTPHLGEAIEGVRWVHVLGRLKPGVTGAQAEADLLPIVQDLQRQSPRDFPEHWRTGIKSFAEQFRSGLHDALWILFGAVGLLLLISCVNVSNLLLSKATGRGKEIAVRISLGASRFRIIRQLLCESAILAVAGGVLGMGLAKAGLVGIIAMVPPDTIPDEAVISLNVPVLLFALGVSAAAALLFGLAPALQLSGGDVATPLKEAGRGGTGTARQRFLRSSLVVGEIALSLMLLIGASLMIRTLIAIQNVDPGFHPDRILTLRVPLSDKRYPDAARRNAFFTELLRRVQAVPGVEAAGLTSGLPPFGDFSAPVQVSGGTNTDSRPVLIHNVNQDYRRAMSLNLIQGRFLDERDVSASAHTAVVNEAFARRYLSPNHSLGRMVSIPRVKSDPFNLSSDGFQIAGIVRDTMNDAPEQTAMPEIFIPYTVTGAADRLVVLAAGSPALLAGPLRTQVYSIDKDQPVTDLKTIQAMLDQWLYSTPRFNLLLFAIFAAFGLLLALFGIYGVVASSIAHRTREIGIRMALGATVPSVVAMILRWGMKLVGAGVALGIVASLLSARVLAGQIWKLSAFDPYSFVAVSLLVGITGLFACFWPARAAARIDPADALRQE
jgi:predicted permease